MLKSTEKYSPRWLKDLLNAQFEFLFDRAVKWLTGFRYQDFINLTLFFLFLAFALNARSFQVMNGFMVKSNPQFSLIYRHVEYASTIFTTLAIGTFSVYIPWRSLHILQYVGFIFGIGSFIYFTPPEFSPLDSAFELALNLGIMLLFYAWYKLHPNKISSLHYLISLFVILFVLRSKPEPNQQELVWLVDSVRFIFVFSLLTLEDRARISSFKSSEESNAYLFSPAHLITPIPIESVNWTYRGTWDVRLRGLCDIGFGYAFIYLGYLLKRELNSWNQTDLNTAWTFTYGFLNYIYYFLGSFAWISIPAGVARWYGVRLPNYFDWPLLASNPFDRWKRWNIYYYNWLNKVIFFPIFKKTKSMGLGITAVFAATIFIHHGRVLDGIELYPKVYFTRAAFFIAHGICVYIALKFKNLWPSDQSRKGWLGVLAVTFLMTLIHLLGN